MFHKPILSIYSGIAESVVNSYAQLFFSDNRIFALLLLLSTFVDPRMGASGLFALLVSIGIAHGFSLPEKAIRSGVYSFNSLLLGLVMGNYFAWTSAFWLLLILASSFTLLVSVWLNARFYSRNLPILALPFLVGIWTVLLSIRSLNTPELSERGIYALNDIYAAGGSYMVRGYEWIQSPPLPAFIIIFLKSLGAIFFQYNIVSGACIALGLLIYSRIAFTLAFLGFSTGYAFYAYLGGGFSELQYSYIGFNFILSAIALGGFFVIPGIRSYLLVILMTPVIALLVSATGVIFSWWQLPLYALPFNLILLMMLQVLRLNFSGHGLQLAKWQLFQPEKNLYRFRNDKFRYASMPLIHLHPPFYGTWIVSQDQEGVITHLGLWKYAWDFVIKNDQNSSYRNSGTELNDFFAYNIPVVASASGTVVTVEDHIEDNPIGDVNLEKNWGNTIILYHADYLYSKISHLKPGSIKVKVGDYVQKGDTLAACGNSGRSPEPHIHFQMQSTPYIGSHTLQYPLSYYFVKKAGKNILQEFSYPKEGEAVSTFLGSKNLREAFTWIPGKIWLWEVQNADGNNSILRWEVTRDAFGYTCLWCARSKSTAWFYMDQVLFRFTWFSGDKNSLLYHFFLAHYKVLLAHEPGVEVNDELPLHLIWKNQERYLQDFLAPFYVYQKGMYSSSISFSDNPLNPENIEISAEVIKKSGNKNKSEIKYKTYVKENIIHRFDLLNANTKLLCIQE